MEARPDGHGFIVAAALVLLLTSPGCSKKSTAPVVGDCDAKVAQAEQALEDILYQQINSNPQRPSDIDFQSAYQLYQEALQCSSTNPDANFGVSVLGLLALTSDAEVNAAFDEWKAYLATHSPFSAPVTRSKPLGIPLSPGAGPDALRLPFDLATSSVVALAQPRRATADPQIGRVQAILEARVLPRLTQALSRLATVGADPNYRFVVTPRMQGDQGANPREIDRTDILALRAACGLLASTCYIAVSYDLSFAAYDSSSLLQALTPGSGWMALRPQGAAHMGNAGTTLLEAADDLDAAIASLKAENDSQDDDVIRIGPDGVSAAEAESIQVHLDNVRLGLQAGYTRVDDWDGNPFTPDVPLTIRLGQMFANPIPDWKAAFPAYTASVVRAVTGTSYISDGGNLDVVVDAPADGYFQATYILNIQNRQVVSEYYYGDEFLRTSLTQIVQDRYAIGQTTPGWTGSFSGVASFGGNLTAGPNTISAHWESYTTVALSSVFVPVITWTADSFDQWVWPDPTFHGLLPGMTSSNLLLDTFGITANQWQKVVALDWAGSGPSPARRRPLP